jgi:hypothetical protein
MQPTPLEPECEGSNNRNYCEAVYLADQEIVVVASHFSTSFTISPMSQRVSVSLAAIAGDMRTAELIRAKLYQVE